jgi:hypothetical protein
VNAWARNHSVFVADLPSLVHFIGELQPILAIKEEG